MRNLEVAARCISRGGGPGHNPWTFRMPYTFGMIAILEKKRTEVAALCRQFGVERLDVFGSAATGSFDAGASDFDFVVKFSDTSPGSYADRYLDFAEALERLLGRRVDLLTERSVKSPVFRKAVESTRQPVYERAREEAPA